MNNQRGFEPYCNIKVIQKDQKQNKRFKIVNYYMTNRDINLRSDITMIKETDRRTDKIRLPDINKP